jgi:hypothetical protein
MVYDWDGVRTRRIRRTKWAVGYVSTLAMAAFLLENFLRFG